MKQKMNLEQSAIKERAKKRLEHLRKEIINERISYYEIEELKELKGFIDDDDTLLLQWAGVKEENS